MAFDVDMWLPDGGLPYECPTLDTALADAKNWLVDNAGGCDSSIELGSLDCPDSISFLERAIGRRFAPEKGEIWLPEEVRSLAQHAQWADPEGISPDIRWAYWSARKFLEICVEHDLGLWTS